MTAKLLNWKGFSDARNARISPPALSVALLVGSVYWLIGVIACYVASGFKDDWSRIPLLWLLALMVTPSVCFSIGIILVNVRGQSRLSWFDRCALVAAFFPVTFGSFLAVEAVKVIFGGSFQETSIGLKIFGTSTCVALVAIAGTMIWKTSRNYLSGKRPDGGQAV